MRQLLPKMLVFVTVVEEGSFTAAAQVLGNTKSVVSQHISQLEKDLEVKLLQRSTRHLSLTHIGQQFFKRCKELETLTKVALDDLQQAKAQPQGPLAVTCPFTLADPIVIPALAELCKLYPAIQPRLLCNDNRLNLHNERIDVAISVGPLKDSNYHAQRISGMQNILCTSPTYLSRQPKLKHIEDIVKLHFVAVYWQEKHSDWTFVSGNKSIDLTLTPSTLCNTLPHAMTFLQLGQGIGIVPKPLAAEGLSTGKLIHIFPEYVIPERSIYAVHPYQKQAPLRVRRFIELVHKHCQAYENPM